MTLIQPERRFSNLIYLIGGLITVFAGAAFWLVAMYANVVDLEHDMDAMKSKIQALEATSGSLRDKTYTLLDPATLETLVNERGLVKDRNPRYVTIDHEWSLVSRY